MVEAPSVVYVGDGSVVAVCDLLSTMQDYSELEQKVIELHKVRLEVMFSLPEP